ncbi:MAG TPA: hypothetical protein VH092_07455 [Urbifossiella sp.]|jgi:hypothetical protein|nr:hypothetical protein [Urbifossiella sp.]
MPYKDPNKARNYQREYRQTRRSGDRCTTPVHPAIPTPTRLQTAADVIELLQEQAGLVRADSELGTAERARVVGYLAGVALKAIEVGNLAARLEELETVLKRRSAPVD